MKISMDSIKCSKAYENGYSMIKYMQLDFTGKCNSNCKGCCGWRNHTGTEMPYEKALEILNATLGEMNIKEIFLCCQAEFTLYSHCLDVINHIEDNYKNVIMRQDTNGIYIPDGFIDRMNSLKNNYYDLSVSFWGGSKDEYKEYHGANNFDKVKNNIKRYLEEIKNPRVTFRFSTVFWNEEQFESALNCIKDICEEYNKSVKILNTISPEDVLEYTTDKNEIVVYRRCSYYEIPVEDDFNDDTYGVIREKTKIDETGKKIKYKEQMITKDWNGLRKPLDTDNNCFFLNRSMLIRIDGGVAGCLGTNDYHENDLGNIFDQPVTAEWFKKIYTSEKRKKQQLLNATTGAFACCHKCISRICY